MNAKRTFSRVSGFTVTELIVAMGILAIVSGIAYPNFQRTVANGNLKTAARDLVADINSLRARAMADSSLTAPDRTMTFDQGNNQYSLPGMAAAKSPASFSADINLQAVPAGGTFTFMQRGTLTPPGTVILMNGRGSTATITCNLSGRTNVQFNML